MAKVQTSHEKAVKTAVKNRNKKKKNAPSSQDVQMVFCILCRRSYLKHEGQDHMHSMLHHRELETVLDKNSFHECQACQEISMSLNEYARHISTAQHKFKLKRLISKNVKPASLYKTLGNKTVTQILDRNKTLKMRHKKEKNKERKKRRQLAGQGRAEEMQQGAAKKKTVRNSERVSTRILKNMQQSHVEGSNSAAVQNKRNEVSSQQRPAYQRESTLQLESDRWAWQQPFVHDQFNQSTHRLRYFGSQCSEDKFKKPQTERHVRNVHNIQVGVTDMSEHITWPAISQQDQCNEPCDSETEFTSDLLPQNGALIFDHSSHESRGSSQSGKEGSRCSAQPASANRSASAAPIRDVDISVMLRQIRRSLGVREPCRADREARKQNSEAGIWLADKAGTKKVQPECSSFRNSASFRGDQSNTTSGRSSLFNSSDPASHSGVRRSNVDPAKPKHAGVQMSQGTTQQCEKSSVVACDSNRPSNSRERESAGAFGNHTSHSRCSGGAASSETNLTITRRVRIAHRRSTVQGDNEFRLSPTLNNSLSSPGAQRKLSWREMYEGMRRKKQEKGKNIPRFGIELANPPSHQESSTQADYLPLSEGFHWESVPDSPAGPQWTTLPPPPLDTADTESHTETQSDSQIQEPLEPPGAAQEAYSSQKLEALPVKGEPNLKDENEELRNHSSPKKRKHKVQTHEDISDEKPRGKKKKSKSNMDDDQIDQLLAVSLREEELSHSLQDLDQSLIQARSTLQAAYAEVQRLLLLAQQFTAEVNSLRVKRIEILQGMQEGYSVESPTRASEEPTTSSSAFPTATQPRDSPIPSSNSQQPLPTNPVSSISQLYPTQFALEIAPVMPLLLTSSLAAPPADATSLKQQEKVTKAELQDCEKTTRLARGGADAVSEVGNPRPAAESPFVCAKDQPGDDGGNKSDSSFRMIEPSNLVVINIDESDNEETASDVRTQQDPLQMSVSVEVNPATTQQNDAERKAEPTLTPVEDATASPACAVAAEDEEPSVGAFEKHTGPVYGLQVHEGLLYTCSGDNTARAHSLTTRECQAVFKGHTNKVNCLLVSSPPSMAARLFTGSSDQTIRCYSLKTQKCLEQISLSDSVLCLHAAWNILFAGLANGSVASHDLKTLKRLDVFECHGPRGVSCLGTAQEGARRVLLVGSYDSTISVRDAKSSLLLRSLEGHTKTVLCMTVVNDLVFSGSSDTSVHAHNIHTGELIRVYKGHSHGVTSVAILGNVMVTACLDKLVRVYELQSHNCLQVYGGHSGMVMCMAVHKSVMYTGCLDGSVQAVKLDLMNNYHCWWQNCPLIFGVAKHLVEHLVGDHTNPNSESVKCRWRGCSTFFATQQSVKQELPEHMQSHVKNAREVQL